MGWLKLKNRLYIHPTVDIPSTDTKTKIEETDDNRIDQGLTVSNNENILDETDDKLEEYDAHDDDNKSKGDENNANDNEWMPDDSNDSITVPITSPPTTNKKKGTLLQDNLISAASQLKMPMDYIVALATQTETSCRMAHMTIRNMNI